MNGPWHMGHHPIEATVVSRRSGEILLRYRSLSYTETDARNAEIQSGQCLKRERERVTIRHHGQIQRDRIEFRCDSKPWRGTWLIRQQCDCAKYSMFSGSTEGWESQWWVVKSEERFSHPVDFQSIDQIVNSFVIDSVLFKIRCCETLRRNWTDAGRYC